MKVLTASLNPWIRRRCETEIFSPLALTCCLQIKRCHRTAYGATSAPTLLYTSHGSFNSVPVFIRIFSHERKTSVQISRVPQLCGSRKQAASRLCGFAGQRGMRSVNISAFRSSRGGRGRSFMMHRAKKKPRQPASAAPRCRAANADFQNHSEPRNERWCQAMGGELGKNPTAKTKQREHGVPTRLILRVPRSSRRRERRFGEGKNQN